MSFVTTKAGLSLAEIGLTSVELRRPDRYRALVTFAADSQPACQLVSQMHQLGYDTIGPAPIGEGAFELIRVEKPDAVVIRIDDEESAALTVIPKIWKDFSVPVIVLTSSNAASFFHDATALGAFAVLHIDSPIQDVDAAFTVAVHRGSALAFALHRIGQLERNLANRRIVEQAKWKLVQEQGMDEPGAHHILQSVARNTRAPLVDVAQSVLDGKPLPRFP